MDAISYQAPESVEEAVALLAAAPAGRARALAGGTDLLIQLGAHQTQPALIVDLKRIAETMAISMEHGGLLLGAAVCCAEIREHPEVAQAFPGLAEAIALIGSEQIQGRASVGGNLCNASPAADAVPPLIALQAECRIAGPGGRRSVPVSEFVTGPAQTVLGTSELLVALQIPAPAPRSADAYLRLTPRTEMDIAVAGAAVNLTLDPAGVCTAARVALGAVAPTPIGVPAAARALVGTALDEEALANAGRAASAACNPIDDVRGTAAYRRSIAAVLTRRAAAIAAERARRRN
jgi:CO/xanthine dehydrogenase FAD-binding subunit